MVIDLIVAVVMIIALIIGYQRGVIQPLMAEIFFFGTLLLAFRFHDAFTNEMQKLLHVNSVLSVAIALVAAVVLGAVGGAIGGAFHRMEAIRGIDGLLGIFVHLGVMFVVVYLGVSALVTLDNAFVPALKAAGMTANEVKQLEDQILSNPITTALVSKADLQALTDAANKTNTAHIDTVSGIHQLQQIYTNFLQPQLHQSKLVPFILRIGHHIPFIGHVGPNDLKPIQAAPVASPARVTSPTPTPHK